MSTIDILRQFKDGLTAFLDELIHQLPQEGELVIYRIFVKDKVPISHIMKFFAANILPYKQMVKDHNDDFFLNHCRLFEQPEFQGSSNQAQVNKFKRIWTSSALDDDDREVVWEWFESFIYLAERYMKSLIV